MKQRIKNWLGINTLGRYDADLTSVLLQLRARVETLENEGAASTLKLFNGLSERIAVLEKPVVKKRIRAK